MVWVRPGRRVGRPSDRVVGAGWSRPTPPGDSPGPADALRLRPRREEPVLRPHRTAALRRRPVVLAVLAAVGAVGLVAPARAEDPAPPVPAVVGADLGPDAPPPVAAVDADDASSVAAIVETDEGLQVVSVPAVPGDAADVVTDLERDPDVVDAFIDVPATIAGTDEHRDEQWNRDELDLDSAPLPAGAPDGSTKVVAVIDTGVDATHEDFQEPDPSRPGHTRSRVRCDLGADFTKTSQRSVGTGCADPHGHGTHVAGIVSAVADNDIGVAGVSAARIMPVRVLDGYGRGLTSRIVAGIIWAVKHHASVINLSIVSDFTTAYDAAIQYALSHNVVVVAAAGNNRAEGNEPQSPSSNDGVLAVAATDENGLSAPFSYSGTANFIAAPGQDVISTVPDGYAAMTGTSMAAPHVAAIVARYRALHPTATVGDIRTAIQTTAIDLETPERDADTGYGLINAFELLTGTDAPAHPSRGVVPTTPRGITARPDVDGLVVHWTPPAYDGGSVLTSYDVLATRVIGGVRKVVAGEAVDDSVTTAKLDMDLGLERNVSYEVVVTADNVRGQGQFSLPTNAVRIPTAPGAPRIGTPNAGPGAARVRWSTPTSNGGSAITGYLVKAYQGSTKVREVTVPASARDVRLAGLTNGRAHTFLVQAVNAVGRSPYSARSIAVTPRQVPGAPSIGRPAPLDDAVRVFWKPPADNGGAYISGYVVRAWQGSRLIRTVSVSGSVSTALVTGLANKGYYAFTVTAKNAAGLGAPSTRSTTVRTT